MIDFRLIRGGAWDDRPRNCRSDCRVGLQINYLYGNVGVRVVCLYQAGHIIRLEGTADG